MKLVKKISKSIGIIKRISYLIPSYILKNLYFTLIYPYLTYCNLIWTSTYDTHLIGLVMLQKKAVRIITKSPSLCHTKPLFAQYGLLNIKQIRFLQLGTFMYQYSNNILPPSFTSYFPPVVYPRPTRGNRDYLTSYAKTNVLKFSIKFQGPVVWNNLPKSIRLATSLPQFKRMAHAHSLSFTIPC